MDLKKYDISSLENVTVGGEALNHEVFDKYTFIDGEPFGIKEN